MGRPVEERLRRLSARWFACTILRKSALSPLSPPRKRSHVMSAPTDLELNRIGVLKRRAIEARVLAPLVEAMAAEFGADRVHAIVHDVIVTIARRQGAALAEACGG